MLQGGVQLRDGRLAPFVEMGQNVGLALADGEAGAAGDIDGDAVRGAVHIGDQFQLGHIDNNTTDTYYSDMNNTAAEYLLGSAALGEQDLADRMERCVYPNAEFHHADHLRLARHYLGVYGSAEAVDRMQQTIQRFAASLGHPEKYHASVTIGWMRLVAAAMRCTPECGDFGEFLAGHGWLLNRDALVEFYSRERLASPAARSGWVEPDLHPLP